MNVNKQTVVIVGQLKVISIEMLEKILRNEIALRDLFAEEERGTFWLDCSER